eukprot:50225-Eustigmatos_ZCMA.PRE.1
MEKMHAVVWAAAKAGEATGAPSSAANDVRGAVGCGPPPSVCPTCGRGPQSVAFSQEFIQELNRHVAAYICRICIISYVSLRCCRAKASPSHACIRASWT